MQWFQLCMSIFFAWRTEWDLALVPLEIQLWASYSTDLSPKSSKRPLNSGICRWIPAWKILQRISEKHKRKKALDYVKTNVAPSFSRVFLLFTHLFAKLTSHTSLAMFSSWLLWALSQGPPGFQPRGGGIICIGGKPPDAIFFGVFCTDCYFGLNHAYHRKAPKSAKILAVACHGWYRQRSPWRHDFSFVVATEVEEEDWKATKVADHVVVRTEKKNPLAIEKGKYTRGLLLCSCRRKEKHSEVENRENRVHFFRGK